MRSDGFVVGDLVVDGSEFSLEGASNLGERLWVRVSHVAIPPFDPFLPNGGAYALGSAEPRGPGPPGETQMNACKPALLSACLLSFCLPALAQDSSVFWEKGLTTAIERARRLQRPILAALHAPGNKASETFLSKTYADGALRAILREYVCIAGTEKPFPKIQDGARKGFSQAFGTIR